jgi:succinoglycan biosynthesis protein ExoV
MRVVYYRSPTGNFGDDLNAVLWRDVLPAACFGPDDTILLGIGSIFRDDFLSESATRGKRVFVLGSGAGTGPLPRLWPHPRWRVLAVRGPLTARLIGQPGSDVTDAAALLAIAPRLLPMRCGGGTIAFFPHYNTVEHSRWPEVCKLTGLTFIDAHRPISEIMNLLGQARLVVTEAMHGAIVADTLRIPWIPVVCSPAIASFKWVDWARSMELEYRPLALPPSSGWEAFKHLKIRLSGRQEAFRSAVAPDDAELIDAFYRRHGEVTPSRTQPGPTTNGTLKSAVRAVVAPYDRIAMHRAASALTRAANSRAYLSADHVLANRVERLNGALETLRRELAA